MERFTETDCSKCGVPVNVDLDPQGDLVRYDDAQRAFDAERANRLAMEACVDRDVKAIKDLKAQLATLQAQLRQVEGERVEWERKCRDLCQAHGVLLIEHHDMKKDLTTLRQLVEAFRSSEEWGAVKAWMVEGAPTRQEGVEAAKRITKAQYEMENALVVCRQALAAQDAGKAVSSG